jgi:2-amino-4-hydroxy-6-hydroxymethyldihydropteridine diphosphokinase
MIDVYIGLGSNLAQPQEQLIRALTALAALPSSQLLKYSSFYRSQPMGPQDQADFVNAVACLQTELSPQQLLPLTQSIEAQQGRVRKDQQWGPRTLDLDILLFGQLQIDSPELTIPHYGMQSREFVLYPLFELCGDMPLPDGDTLSSWLAQCPLNGLEKLQAVANLEIT